MMEQARAGLGHHWPSIGRLTEPLLASLIAAADLLRVGVGRSAGGATIIDAGIERPGGLEAGRRIAEICMGGAGWVSFTSGTEVPGWPFRVQISSGQPVLACLAAQYAGWSLLGGNNEDAWFAMASGPGRARAAGEKLYDELGYRDTAPYACLVLETAELPREALIEQVAESCALPHEALTFILTPTSSLAGTVQIVARVLEVALHKAHVLHFPLADIVDGLATVPLPPPSPDFMTAMGRTNDAVLFGGEVHLFVTGPDDAAADLAERLPSSTSRDYGRPFKEVFQAANGDFYAIDSLLFSPARVAVTALGSGRTFRAGRLAPELIERSFGSVAA